MSAFKERITLSADDINQRFWVHDATHMGFAMTPLFQSFMMPALDEGMSRAASRLGVPMGEERARIYHDYYYASVQPAPGDPEQNRAAFGAKLEALFPRIRQDFDRIVTDEILPRYRALERATDTVRTTEEAMAGLQRLQQIYVDVFEQHMLIVLPVFAAQERYQDVYSELFPDRNPIDAHALLSGHMNKFLEADQALSQLAQEASTSASLREAIASADPLTALRKLPEATAFFEHLTSFTDMYGWRVGATHDFYEKSWQEDLGPVLSIVRQFMDSGYDFSQQWHITVSEREAKLKETLEALPNANDRDRFLHAYQVAYDARPIDEDHHFYIDAMLPSKSRPFLLRVGAMLVEQGALTSADDLFFLYLDEVSDLLQGSRPVRLIETLEARRQSYMDHRQETPPPSLGTPQATTTEAKGVPAKESVNGRRMVQGASASAGVFHGTARILTGPEDFSLLQAGDVLIARTTTPVWSALFAIAGAVVTDSGGILSHAATVAREYRVPCVVATKDATQIFRDGERVVVDGDHGTVTADSN